MNDSSFPRDGKSESDEDRSVLDLLGLPSPRGWCPSMFRHAMGRDNRCRVVWTPCKCWSCSICAQSKRVVAGLRYGVRLMMAERVFHTLSPNGRWDAARVARSRSKEKASFVRVAGPASVATLLATRNLGDGREVSKLEAVKLLAEALSAIVAPPKVKGHRFRPVSNSSDWRPLPRRESEWESLGWTRFRKPSALIATLHNVGIEATEDEGVVTWEFPTDWSDEQVEAMKVYLFQRCNS